MTLRQMIFGAKCSECHEKIRGAKHPYPGATPSAQSESFVCSDCREKIEHRQAAAARREKEEQERRQAAADRREREEQERRDKAARDERSVALLKAAAEANLDDARLLIEAGADVNHKGDVDHRPLHDAVCTSSTTMTTLLLDAGANIEAPDSYGQTPLHWVCARNHVPTAGSPEIVRLLLDRGANVNATDKNLLCPLHCAAIQRRTELGMLLLERGADPFALTRRGRSAFYYSVEADAPDLQAELGRRTGERVYGWVAEVRDANELLGVLREQRPIIRLRVPFDELGMDSLSKAHQKECAEALRLNRPGGYDTRQGKDGQVVFTNLTFKPLAPERTITADYLNKKLILGAEHGYLDDVRGMLSQGACVDAVDPNGSTALFFAAGNGHAAIVDLLLSNGADALRMNKFGESMLFPPTLRGHLAIVETFLGRGVSPSRADAKGRTPLLVASISGHLDVVKALLAAGADPNVVIEGHTAAEFADSVGKTEVASLLRGV